ncbi:MAG: hypothetical protein HYT28_03670 [Parcubacteria group bacterium]|nr:hypothetical protein [Parcubacteria group bacterium]
MSFEQQPHSAKEEETENGIAVCRHLKEKEPDPFHWGPVECEKIIPEEAILITKFSALKEHPSVEEVLSFNTEVLNLHRKEGYNGAVTETLLNEIAVLLYDIKHSDHGNVDGSAHYKNKN